VRALGLLADEGAASVYEGSIAEALLELVRERDGLVTRVDLESYQARWEEPVELEYAGRRVVTRAGLAGIAESLARLPTLRGRGEVERVVALVEALSGPEADGHTTNLVTVDADRNACVFTSSLGLGSGDFLPGLDLHLNSMLGEADLLRGPLEPGERMQSMMAPTLAFDRDGLELAGGAAGGTRLRTALVGVVAGILDEGLEAQAAVDRARCHPVGRTVHAEPGVGDAALTELERRGWSVQRWADRHHYFGGVSVLTRTGAGADPRRSGGARELG
jgi:gamma-glutamyltranspeptidase/glutathione hydrolase